MDDDIDDDDDDVAAAADANSGKKILDVCINVSVKRINRIQKRIAANASGDA